MVTKYVLLKLNNYQPLLCVMRWVSGREWVEWRGWLGVLTLPVDTADQAVCPVGHSDSHSSPDYTMNQADIQWNIS